MQIIRVRSIDFKRGDAREALISWSRVTVYGHLFVKLRLTIFLGPILRADLYNNQASQIAEGIRRSV